MGAILGAQNPIWRLVAILKLRFQQFGPQCCVIFDSRGILDRKFNLDINFVIWPSSDLKIHGVATISKIAIFNSLALSAVWVMGCGVFRGEEVICMLFWWLDGLVLTFKFQMDTIWKMGVSNVSPYSQSTWKYVCHTKVYNSYQKKNIQKLALYEEPDNKQPTCWLNCDLRVACESW